MTKIESESAGRVDRITVCKKTRELQLHSKGNVIKKYRVSLGGNPVGHKEVEGDKKTPEGTYQISAHNPNSQYYKSLRISYPNLDDIKKASALNKSAGGDIMIHGLGDTLDFLKSNRINDWTLGCIAVTNQEIDEIYQLVADGTTIEITP